MHIYVFLYWRSGVKHLPSVWWMEEQGHTVTSDLRFFYFITYYIFFLPIKELSGEKWIHKCPDKGQHTWMVLGSSNMGVTLKLWAKLLQVALEFCHLLNPLCAARVCFDSMVGRTQGTHTINTEESQMLFKLDNIYMDSKLSASVSLCLGQFWSNWVSVFCLIQAKNGEQNTSLYSNVNKIEHRNKTHHKG